MALPIIADTETARNLEARRNLARMELYRRVGRIGRTPTRAYVVAYLAWRIGDVPFEPDPADLGLDAATAAAWRMAVDGWIEEVTHGF